MVMNECNPMYGGGNHEIKQENMTTDVKSYVKRQREHLFPQQCTRQQADNRNLPAYLNIKACVARFSRSGPEPEPPTEASAPAIFDNEAWPPCPGTGKLGSNVSCSRKV